MKDVTLVVMAAGIGSRFGGGIKQLEPMGPGNEIIMDYSIHDAIEAGFNKVVFVIRKDLEKDFEEVIGKRIREKVHIEYAFQEINDIPEQYKESLKGRKKPWGTGQAILACKDLIHEPFLVINADDFYGKEAYVQAYNFLSKEQDNTIPQFGMVGVVLKNTLSEHGGVTRAICMIEDHKLLQIVEKRGIQAINGKVLWEGQEIDADSIISMNMWGMTPVMFTYLEKRFETFLSGVDPETLQGEFLVPTIIGTLLKEKQIEVEVLSSNDKWFGVTYREDIPSVKENIRHLIDEGKYPEKL